VLFANVPDRVERILVVDDEKGIIFGLRQYFAQQGYPVDCATSSEEALEHLAANQYGVAIIDVELRGGDSSSDGLNLAAFIRSHAPATVVIILSAHESPETHKRALDAGVHSFVSKPARLSLLADVAVRLMHAATVAAVL
jgi:DNA-binding response OmpR family regulator